MTTPHPARVVTAVAAALVISTAWGASDPGQADAGLPVASTTPVTQQVQADWEGLIASDILLTQASLAYRRAQGRFEFTTSIALNTIDLDYQPASFDFLGSSTSVDEHRFGGAVATRTRLLEPLTLLLSGAAYTGFPDYRTAWLNEYFRQQFGALPGYQQARPSGESVTFGLRLEYLPTIAFVQGDISYMKDSIAPGYEIDFDGLRRGRPNLYTASYHVAFENVLHRRVRLLNEARLTDTTDRENRYSYQGSLNVAVGERWVARVFGGYAEERPTFRAAYAGGSIEFEPSAGWLFSASGRHYSDTGEIENSLFSSAAPGLTAWQFGFGVRRVWDRHSVKAFVAPYATRFEPAGIGTAFFRNLYSNRDWALVQAAYTVDF
jgi:hypothetical protein